MALDSPKFSILLFPRKVSTVAIIGGLVASFFVFGSLLRLSDPISSSVSGVFYGNGTPPEQVEIPSSLRNHTVKGLYTGNEIKTSDKNLTSQSSSSPPNIVSSNISPPDKEKTLMQEKEDTVSKETLQVGSDEGETSVPEAGADPPPIHVDPPLIPSVSSPPRDDSETASAKTECDLYQGSWFYDPAGPLYTNNSCPVLTQMQNCQGNGRPDKSYENWRWKPSQKFLELVRGKTLAFVGDSVARNQMESMLCLLWQVETPENRGNKKMHKWFFKSSSVTIIRIWSSWLVHQFNEKFDYAPKGVAKLNLDVPDERIIEPLPSFDVVVLSSGHWFTKRSVYISKEEIVGGQLWWPDTSIPMKVNKVEAFGISVETILKSIATHSNFTGLIIVRTWSPDHYTSGSCTGKEEPILPGKLVKKGFTEIMHEKQVTGFNRVVEGVEDSSKVKLKLMDITEAFGYRHDGHPGPYRSLDPNKITKKGLYRRRPPQDCLHWCMPGPVDTWNEMVLELIRRDLPS